MTPLEAGLPPGSSTPEDKGDDADSAGIKVGGPPIDHEQEVPSLAQSLKAAADDAFRDQRQAPPAVLVLFGASGDLANRKILPALAGLIDRQAIGPAFSIVGVARTDWSDDEFKKAAIKAVPGAGPSWASAVEGFRYISGEYGDAATFAKLAAVLKEVDSKRATQGNRVYYLATLPSLFATLSDALGAAGLNRPENQGGFVRLVVEKPFGRDLESANSLDARLHSNFDEDQIYRIDHYMGKETVQNLLALRFANAMFEPVWNRRYLDHIQVTVAESIGVERRGEFYETAGALRDIVQNHVMQVLSLTLMEPPATVDANGIRDEKVKLLRAVVIPTEDQVIANTVRAQYRKGWVEGEEVVGYREEPRVSPSSTTETYVALQLNVDNWRWAGVPIYVRTGKRLPKRATEVALQFQRVPHLPFSAMLSRQLGPNAMVLRIQPDEGITLRFGAKVPGQAFEVRSVSMDFSYEAAFLEEPQDAYERLMLDALSGDPTLFIRTDEVDQAWRIVSPVLAAFSDGAVPLSQYAAGTWGPREADRLLQRDGRVWRKP